MKLKDGRLFETVEHESFAFLSPGVALLVMLVEIHGRDGTQGQLEGSVDGLVATSLNNGGLMEEAVRGKGIQTVEVLIDQACD